MSRCKNCLFSDICKSHNLKYCDDYSPIDSDKYIYDLVEKGREEFRQEWFKYSSQYD